MNHIVYLSAGIEVKSLIGFAIPHHPLQWLVKNEERLNRSRSLILEVMSYADTLHLLSRMVATIVPITVAEAVVIKKAVQPNLKERKDTISATTPQTSSAT
jgi:hypothetical protein